MRRSSSTVCSAMPRASCRRGTQCGRGLALHHFQLQAQEQQRLAGLVVELAADAAAFLLLGAAACGLQAADFALQARAFDGLRGSARPTASSSASSRGSQG